MKVIFLDFDGVLNSEKYVRGCEGYGVVIDPSRMVLLKQIVEKTDAVIVLSTSWREHWDADLNKADSTGRQIHELFTTYGLCIADKTPALRKGREHDIRSWLDQHHVEKFVVLDDRLMSADFLNGHMVKTSNYFDGLDESDVQRAIDILNETESDA